MIEEARELPSPWQPSPWATVALFFVIITHALYHLVCRWILAFKTKTQYCPANRIGEGGAVV